MDRSFNPPPWKLDGDVIRDASGGVVISAFNPCNTAVRKMIVESVNAMAAAEAVTQAVKAIDPHALPPFREEYAVKMFGHVWKGDSEEDFELLKTLDGARKIVDRLESDDLMQGFWDHPKRTIVRRVVGEWEDA